MEKNKSVIKSPEEQRISKLKDKFRDEIASYIPDWKKIIYANQTGEDLTTEEIVDKKILVFRERLTEIRKSRGLTQEQMAERLSCSKQYVSKIENIYNENCKIVKIPTNKLDYLHERLDIPVAYLLGLIDDETYEPDITEYYFWENPNSPFNEIKEIVKKKGLIHAMIFGGLDKKKLEQRVAEQIVKNYDLLVLMDSIMNCGNPKRDKLIRIMKCLYNLL